MDGLIEKIGIGFTVLMVASIVMAIIASIYFYLALGPSDPDCEILPNGVDTCEEEYIDSQYPGLLK